MMTGHRFLKGLRACHMTDLCLYLDLYTPGLNQSYSKHLSLSELFVNTCIFVTPLLVVKAI
jgi:hypothetical protein